MTHPFWHWRARAARRIAPALVLAAALAGCMPRAYERQVPVLEGTVLDDYTVQHGEAGDCLLRRILPTSYEVRRPGYTLLILPAAGYRGEPLQLELRLAGEGLALRAPGAELSAKESGAPDRARYRLAVKADAAELRLEIWRGEEQLGVEPFRLGAEHCRALLWRDP